MRRIILQLLGVAFSVCFFSVLVYLGHVSPVENREHDMCECAFRCRAQ
jgi:hypothetical protein